MAVGGYALLLAARRGPPPVADAPGTAPRAETPAAPDRLPRRPSVVPASAELAPVMPQADVELTIELDGDLAALGPRAGVAVLDGFSGAQLAWLPLRGDDDQARRRLSTRVPRGSHHLHLAADPELQRHAFWTATTVIADPATAPCAAQLSAARHPVTFECRRGDAPAPDLLLEIGRPDAPHWRLAAAAGALQVTDAEGRLGLALAPGRYTVRVVGDDAAPLRFEVPAPAPVTLTLRAEPVR